MLEGNSLRAFQTQTLAELRKESLDVYNRLHSIAEDVEFVDKIHRHYSDIPMIPNLRCGAWYVNPSIGSGHPAYFKSTDGHFNNWSFNLRRPNVHLLDIISHHKGLILVDSTRSGKRMPDALSKTVPLWCAVINVAIKLKHSKGSDWDTAFYTPPGAVSAQEHVQIEYRIEEWAKQLHHSTYEIPNLPYPLRPLWITPSSTSWPHVGTPSERRFYPVVCVSASRQVHEGIERRTNGFAYVQGSGDDHELWGQGLTPSMFWKNKDKLLHAGRWELERLLEELVAARGDLERGYDHGFPSAVARTGGRIMIGRISELTSRFATEETIKMRSTAYLIISEQMHPEISSATKAVLGKGDTILQCHLPAGKRGQAKLVDSILPHSIPFIDANLARGNVVWICCDSGKDASVGVALAALQLLFDNTGTYVPVDKRAMLSAPDKSSIGTRLQWIIASRPQANPSRATLKRVNEFLMTPQAFRRTTIQ